MLIPKYKHTPTATAKFAVEYACTAGGAFPAEAFLDSLDDRTCAKIEILIERFHREGKISNKEQFKILHGGNQIFEFKHYQTRIMGYYAPSTRRGVIVLTHGFTKKTNETPPAEIRRAERIREEYEGILKDVQQGPKPRR